MSEQNDSKIFEKYNPADAVTPCPTGRASVRKLLDLYAKAAVNLYGIIHKTDFVEIFNSQNTIKTNADEVFNLLLPLVLKDKWYCFYRGYIVHSYAIGDFNYADNWLKAQGDKPRFLPDKDEFLKYENDLYECETQEMHWDALREFIFKEWPNTRNSLFYNQLKNTYALGPADASISKTGELLAKYRLAFSSENNMHEFFNLLTKAINHTRIWSNRGYSPSELFNYMNRQQPKEDSPSFTIQNRINTGLNEPCPCGSGKKYKNCCRITEEAKTAQLSSSDCKLIYETWYGLMGFINNQKRIINEDIKPKYPNSVRDELVYSVREELWKNPKIIDEYLDTAQLTDEKTELLISWRDHHKKGMFFVVDYNPEYAILIGSDDKKEDRLYGIKGISRSLAGAIQRELPAQLETVLLPFKGIIIYDGFISSFPLTYSENAKKSFKTMYDNAKPRGIVTSLIDAK